MTDLWYFAYGSNLSLERKVERTGAVRRARRCRLPQYRLTFNKRPQRGEGACASIVRDPSSLVWGVVYLCDQQTIDILDGHEGVEDGHYRRETVEVITDDDERLEAVTYVAGEDHLCDGDLPQPAYLKLLLDGATQHHLPEDYVRGIEALGRGEIVKQVVYVDMDGVLVDFRSAFPQLPDETLRDYAGHEDDIPGIFALMEPMEGALDAYRELAGLFDAYILSAAPWKNPTAWSDKLEWVRRHLGDVAYKRLILTHHKDLNRGDYLIDDREKRGADSFGDRLVLFRSARYPDWSAVMDHMRQEARRLA
jgi:5'-nucleotidase